MLLQLLVNGLILGSYYSLVSVPLFLLFATTRVLLISLAGVVVILAYTFQILVQLTHTYWLATLGTIPVCIVVLLGILYAVHYPLERRKADPDTHLIAAFATLIILEHLVYLAIGPDTVLVPAGSAISVGGMTIKILNVILVAVFAGAWFGLEFLMRRTWFGRTLNAVASDLELTQLLGVQTRRLVLLSIVLSSILLSVVVSFVVLDTGVDAYSGLTLVLPGLMSLVVGGGSRMGSVIIGSFCIGLLSQLVLYFAPTAWQTGLTYAVLLIVMLSKPGGLATNIAWKHEV
jgi:branched-chain amino acid transport system permease protein